MKTLTRSSLVFSLLFGSALMLNGGTFSLIQTGAVAAGVQAAPNWHETDYNDSAPVFIRGLLRRDVYTNVVGPSLSNLTSHPKFPGSPDLITPVSAFEAPFDFADQYGQRLVGFIHPPLSGNYVFYISSDDESALFLSADANPSNKVLICRETAWSPPRHWQSSPTRTNAANISAPIHLQEGSIYYVEAVMKEVMGGDSLGVAWQMPGQSPPANGSPAIPGDYLSPLPPIPPPVDPPVIVNAADSQEHPAVATDGTNYFIVWMDRRNRETSWTDYDIYGARVSPAGVVLDPDGIVISTNAAWETDPAVAFDGTNYLVVWSRNWSNEWDIAGARVSASGVLLDPGGISICTETGLQSNARVAFNNGFYLVTWNEWRNLWYNGPNRDPLSTAPDIYAARVDRSGVVLDQNGFAVVQDAGSQWSGEVTALSNGFFVVWLDSAQSNLRGSRVTVNGTVSPAAIVGTNHSSSPSGHRLASLGTPGSVGWMPWTEIRIVTNNSFLTDIYAARLTSTGNPFMTRLLVTNVGSPSYVAAAMSPTAFWVVWDTSAGTTNSDIRAAFVPFGSSSGFALPLLVNNQPQLQDQPAVACTPAGCIVAWRDARNAPISADPRDGHYDIYATLVTPTGGVVNANGILVSTMAKRTPVIAWATPAPIVYGNTIGNAQLNATGNVPGAFVYSAEPGFRPQAGTTTLTAVFTPQDLGLYTMATAQVALAVQPATLTIRADDKTKVAGQPNPPLTATYVGFVLGDSPAALDTPVTLYTSATTDSPPGMYVITASGAADQNYSITHVNGTLTVSPSTAPTPARDNQERPAIASDGTNFFIVWMDRRNSGGDWTGYDIYGARMNAAGRVLETNGIPICTLPNPQWYPSVAFDGSNYLVVWSDDRDRNDTNNVLELYGARVSRSGVVLDTNGIRLTRGEIIYQPSVAFNGTEYLVAGYAWQHNGSSATHLLGVRVTRSGTVLDPEEIVLHTSGFDYPAIVASVGREWLVAWNSQPAGVFGVLVSSNGVVGAVQQFVNAGETWIRGLTGVGSNYFLGTTRVRQIGLDTYVHDVYGTWLTRTGVPGSTFLVAANTNTLVGSDELPTHYMQENPTAAGTGASATVVWESGTIYTNGGVLTRYSDIKGARVSTSTAVSPPFTVCNAPHEQSYPAAAYGAGMVVAAWQDARTASLGLDNPDGYYDIYATRIFATNAVNPPNGVLVSGASILPLVLTWAEPDPITYGTELSGTQLNATANVPGTFAYDPPAGTRLHRGTHVLTVTFTPLDLVNYNITEARAILIVNPAVLMIIADDKARLVGQPNPPLTAVYYGFVDGDSISSLDVPPTITTDADINSPADTYTIYVHGAVDNDYVFTCYFGTLAVCEPSTAAGTIDLTFNAGAQFDTFIIDIAKLPNESVYVAGWFQTMWGVPRRHLARLMPHGATDLSFVPHPGVRESVWVVAPQADGKVLIGSTVVTGPGLPQYGMARLNSDGTLDGAFRSPFGSNTWVTSIAPLPGGRILVGGWLQLGAEQIGYFLVRLHANGDLDPSVQYELDGYVHSLVPQPNGKVLLSGGFSHLDYESHSLLARLNEDGTIDEAFEPSVVGYNIYEIALQPDGKIIIGGDISEVDGYGCSSIVRLESDGTWDPSFVAAEELIDLAAMALQPDGKILAGGVVWDGDSSFITAIRLNSDGSRDITFHMGMAEGEDAEIRAMVVQQAGVLVGGTFATWDTIACNGLVRLNTDLVSPFVERTLPAGYMPGAAFGVVLTATPGSNAFVYAIEDAPPSSVNVINVGPGGVYDGRNHKVKFGPFFDAVPRTLSYEVEPPTGTTGPQVFSGVGSVDGLTTPIIGDSVVQLAAEHPADLVPTDNWLRIGEVTAYASAWRRGDTWPSGPVPIPMDFVVRAAFIWQNGECYVIDPNASEPAIMWVPCTLVPDIAALTSRVAESTLPAGFVPGEPLVVNINVRPPSGVSAFAVEDRLPAGWTASSITGGGHYDAANAAIRWGPFTDATPRLLSYTAVPPAIASPASFNGTASFDGTSVEITGRGRLQPSTRLTVERATGAVSINVSGAQGRHCVVEVSDDLARWTTLLDVPDAPARIQVTDEVGTQRFYRARIIE